MKNYKDIDEYINSFPKDIQSKLTAIRIAIHKSAPNATEKISYGMPTFYQNGNLVHFAAFKNHLSLFPAPSGVNMFRDKLKKYQTSKGTIQFKYSDEIPYDLIEQIVKFRVTENTKK